MVYDDVAIRRFAKSRMSVKRFRHTKGVANWAEALASIHNLDREAARVSAYLHDVAKEMTLADAKALLQRHLAMQPIFADMPKIIHAFAGACLVEDELAIDNVDILDAIRYHTTGHPEMSDLAKLIYVADATEPGRDYKGLAEQRALAKRSLDAATLSVTVDSVRYLLSKRRPVHPDTLALYNALLKREEESC